MSLPVLIHDIVLQGGHSLYGRVLCDTWLYVNTDRLICRGDLFTRHENDAHWDYEIVESLATNSSYQKFRVAKLPDTL